MRQSGAQCEDPVRLPLRDALVARLSDEFPSQRMTLDAMTEAGPAIVVFAAVNPAVGDIAVYDDWDELIVFLGHFTHSHFANYDEELTADERAAAIVTDVIDVLHRVFADGVEFFSGGIGGGHRVRDGRRRSVLSRLLLGWHSYVWSGPID